MDDDERKAEKRYPLSASKMSKTPSWIMLGFLLGAAFVAALPPLRKRPAAPPETSVFRAAEPAKKREPREPPQFTTIEAVFAAWGKHAVWSDDVTEVALWNDRDKDYSDFFEVRRYGGVYYFRTIPQLTRRIISRGKPMPESPLLFTETEEQYREWRSYGRSERPVEREAPARPTVSAPQVAPTPIDRSIKVVAPPTLPPLDFPTNQGQTRK
jgi:hypothetical protein